MYVTKDNKYFIVPCSGTKLNQLGNQNPNLTLKEDALLKFDHILLESSFLNEMSRFTNIINDDAEAKRFLMEYFTEFDSINNFQTIFINQSSLNIPLIKSIQRKLHETLK